MNIKIGDKVLLYTNKGNNVTIKKISEITKTQIKLENCDLKFSIKSFQSNTGSFNAIGKFEKFDSVPYIKLTTNAEIEKVQLEKEKSKLVDKLSKYAFHLLSLETLKQIENIIDNSQHSDIFNEN